MGIISGQDSRLQIGLESAWGTGVAPTVQIGMVNESLKLIPNYIRENVLTGRKTVARMDVSGQKVEGDFAMIAKPDNIGLLLACALGEEAAPSHVASSVYDHAFTPVSGGVSGTLPKLTVVVDRKQTVKGYVSCKINQMTLEAAVNDYLRATFSLRGRQEQSDTVETLTYSTLRAFQFIDGNITVDGSSFADVTRFRLVVNNNLEDNLFTMDGSAYMREIEPQERALTVELEALYGGDAEDIRSSKFVAGATASMVCTFQSTELAATALPYKLTISMPLVYITEAHPNVAGPERIRIPLNGTLSEGAATEALTATLRDLKATAYLT